MTIEQAAAIAYGTPAGINDDPAALLRAIKQGGLTSEQQVILAGFEESAKTAQNLLDLCRALAERVQDQEQRIKTLEATVDRLEAVSPSIR